MLLWDKKITSFEIIAHLLGINELNIEYYRPANI